MRCLISGGLIGVLGMLLTAGTMQGAEWFVSPTGNDQQPGTREAPLATPAAARDRVRAWKAEHGDGSQELRVWFLAGRYELPETLILDERDSGTAAAPIVWEALPDAEVRWSGGAALGNWAPIRDPAVRKRLSPAARSAVHVCRPRASGVPDLGRLERRGAREPSRPAGLELFCLDRPMPIAAWPNDGWARIGTSERCGEACLISPQGPAAPAAWREAADGWLHGFWRADGQDAHEPLLARDPDGGFRLGPEGFAGGGPRRGARFRVEHVLEELDAAGEWYLDRRQGDLYFWPPTPAALATARASRLETVLAVYGAEHLVFRGLTIEETRVLGAEIVGGREVALEGCRVRNIGNVGICIDGGEAHRVLACEVHACGEGALRVSGGDRETLLPAGHQVAHNRLHHTSRWVLGDAPALWVEGVGQRVAHNHIHDCPHAGVLLAGNDHVVEYNRIERACLETDDVGGVQFAGGDWTERGHVVRFNHLRDLGGFARRDVIGVYLDDLTSGTLVFGNLIERCGRAIVVGGGSDVVLENNFVAGCAHGLQFDDRARGWARATLNDPQGPARRWLAEAARPDGPYLDRYPELARLAEASEPGATNHRALRNVLSGGARIDRFDGLDEGAVFAADNLEGAPEFRPYDGPMPDSPAWAFGFRRLPLERVGPQQERGGEIARAVE